MSGFSVSLGHLGVLDLRGLHGRMDPARHLGCPAQNLAPSADPDRGPEAGDVRGRRPEIHLELAAGHHVGPELPGPKAQSVPAGGHRHPEIRRAEE